jgi:uncharacterized protein DUF1569
MIAILVAAAAKVSSFIFVHSLLFDEWSTEMAKLPVTPPYRRAVNLHSMDEFVAEIERIANAYHSGGIRTTGNWTAAQVLEHLAKLIEFSYDGFPFRVSWPIRAVSHVAKWLAWERFIKWSFQPGYLLPEYARALLSSPDAEFDPAAGRLRAALARIQSGESMLQPSPFEGRLTHEQFVYVHLRHAELHLSYIQFSDENRVER